MNQVQYLFKPFSYFAEIYIPIDIRIAFSSTHALAFLLAFVASMGTFIGGLVVVVFAKVTGLKSEISKETKSLIGIFQAFSAGVMIYMTFIDLIPEAVEMLGNTEALAWFFAGVVIFMILELVLPEEHDHSDSQPKPPTRGRTKSTKKNIEKPNNDKSTKSSLRTSSITFLAMALHNLPEGLGVYLSALSDLQLGLQLAIGIMLHNVPEGMAVAIPLWAATGSTARVLFMTFLNGLCEPIGVVIGGYLLSSYLTPEVLSKCLAAVGGIMACISFHELFPVAIKFSGKDVAVRSLFVGMFLCFLALETVHLYFIGF